MRPVEKREGRGQKGEWQDKPPPVGVSASQHHLHLSSLLCLLWKQNTGKKKIQNIHTNSFIFQKQGVTYASSLSRWIATL